MSTITNALNLIGGLPVTLAEGGTNQALTASAGGVIWSDSTKFNVLAGTATAGQLLLSGSSATPAWSTSTYPATNAINTLLYASSANVMSALATATTAVLTTSSGVPTWASALSVSLGGTGLSTATTAYAVVCSGTTATGNFQVLSALGASGTVLTSNGAGALPSFQAAGGGAVGATTTSVTQAAHGFSVGNLLTYSGSNDTYALAKADTAQDAEVVGIISATTTNTFTLVTSGVITTLSGLTAGTTYWLSPTSAGNYTSTPPSTAGQINKPVLLAVDTTSAIYQNFRGDVIPGSSTSNVQGNNMIMNGDFQCFQRTAMGFGGNATLAVAASTTEYCLDRFQILTGANQATTITQSKITQWIFGARIQRNSGQTGTGVMQFGTSLTSDMCAGIQGNPVTLQFIVSTGANWSPTSGNLTVTVAYGTGTSNISNISSTFTGVTSVISQTLALGTSAAATLYSFTSTSIPTTATQLSIVFSWTPVGTASTSDYFQIQNLQCEIGVTANLFQRVPLAQQLSNCQQFYQKNIDSTVAPAQAAGNVAGAFFQSSCAASNTANTGVIYRRNTWKNGVVTLYNPVSANAQVYDYKTSADCSASTANTAQGNDGFKLVFATDSGATTNSYYAVIYQVDADIT